MGNNYLERACKREEKLKEIETLLQTGKIKEALAAFQDLQQDQQEDFFRQPAPTLFPPPLIGVLFRKMKPGYGCQDFREAWLPPINDGQQI